MFTRCSTLVVRSISSLAIAVVLSSCAIIVGPDADFDREQRDLSRARRTWASTFIDDYEFVVRLNCFCALGGVAVRVLVQNDVVIAREIESSGTAIPAVYASSYPNIDGIFAVIQEAIDDRAYRIDTNYDSQYGFPTDVYIDYDDHVADEERGYTLERFRSLR